MKVPVAKPLFTNQVEKNIIEALNDKAISGLFGNHIIEFEENFAKFCDTKYAISCSSGTSALHLALAANNIKKGDEVLVSSLTNMATFFAVLYLGAKPVPVDIEIDTLNIDIKDLKKKISRNTKAIMVVHLFGHPVDMDPIIEIANKFNIPLFEDCAEAHGAEYKGKRVGGLSSAGCFSFFANKILTTGEGGMVTTNDKKLADKVKSLKSLAFGTNDKFQHTDIGYNYRLTNIQAAIGCEQVQNADFLINKRIEIANFYTQKLSKFKEFLLLPQEKDYAKNVYWMYHMVINPSSKISGMREKILEDLRKIGIETRQGFVPFNLQKIFIKQNLTTPDDCPVAALTSNNSFYIPSGPDITNDELDYVISGFSSVLERYIG